MDGLESLGFGLKVLLANHLQCKTTGVPGWEDVN